MESCNIFPDTQEFLDSLKKLNEEEENVCVEFFQNLANRMMEEDRSSFSSTKVATKESSLMVFKHEDILSSILERVAFFPVKPTVMEAELSRLGLSPALSSSLSLVWASLAKSVVMTRRGVDTNMQGIHYQVLRTIPGGQEGVLVHLQLEDSKGVGLRFDPAQLVNFYEQLERIQASVDRICH